MQKAHERMVQKGTVGKLHRATHTPAGKNIPASKLAVHKGDSTTLKREKQFAINARKAHH